MSEDKPNAEARPNSAAAPANPPAAKRARRWPWVLVALAAALIVGVIVFYPRAKPAPPAPPPVEVAMVKVQQGAIPVYVNALGTVTPLATVTVSSRVDGQVVKVNYAEGQMVPEGFVLIQIDSRPFDAQLMTAQGQLDRDRELMKEANVNMERYKAAYEQKVIPKQQYDDAASLVRQLAGTVKLDEGQAASAQTLVDYCAIKSPVAGRVGLRRVDAGNIVHASDTSGMAVITQIEPITVVFSVAEDYLPAIQEQLRQGRVLPVEALDRTQKKKIATGTLRALDSQIDTTTGTIRLKAQFDNKDDALFPNQFVNARLLLNTLSGVTLVPPGAIQRSARGAFVYVVKPDHTLEMRPVEVGITEGDQASVTGLEADETIAADNFNRLQEGMTVAERKAAGKASGEAAPGTSKDAKSPKSRKP